MKISSKWVSIILIALPLIILANNQSPLPGGSYDAGIPTIKEVLGFDHGERPIRHHEAVMYLKRLAEVSPRASYVEAGYTHENRLLGYLLVSSETNMKQLEGIKSQLQDLAEVKTVVKNLNNMVATAWMMYSIHGDELSGTDAGVKLAYQLVAGTDDKTKDILDKLVVGIDPMENPDGRERALAQIQQWSGDILNTDGQDIHHAGAWPYGRGNHYLFDLNRDWFILAHPESRARVKALNEWNPILVVDAHEMGAYSTFLFNPPREPINKHINDETRNWWQVFSQDQSDAFDKYEWTYYTRSWYDDFFPGYGSAMPNYWGSVAILYEQSQTDGTVVKKPANKLSSFTEAVHRQFISSMANLTTAATNRNELLQHFVKVRRDANKLKGAYYIVPGINPTRAKRLVERLLMNGIEVYQTDKAISRFRGENYYGESYSASSLPAGSYVIPLGQPLGYLVEAILEFDPRMLNKVLQKEYSDLQKGKGSHLYEVSAWSMLLAYDVDAYFTKRATPKGLKRVKQVEAENGQLHEPKQAVAYAMEYGDDQAIHALLDMYDRGLYVRSTTEPFEANGRHFDMGTLILRRNENPEDLPDILADIAETHGVDVYGLKTMRINKGPDLGGGEFRLLEPPRIAMLTGPDISIYSLGATWYLLDYELETRFSLLNHDNFSGFDLRKYNVIILPGTWGGLSTYKNILGKGGIAKLKDWVKDGGTLIGLGGASAFLADTSSGFSQVQLKRQALGKLDLFEKALAKEVRAEESVDSLVIWESKELKTDDTDDDAKLELEKLKAMDERARLFQPRGTILNAELDPEHWLSFGAGKSVPVTTYTSYAFLAKRPVQTPARYAPAENLRLSGLLWPEAKERWARTAYATRESSGRGQIILFTNEPSYRSYYYGSTRLLLNALLLGPGMGTSVGVDW